MKITLYALLRALNIDLPADEIEGRWGIDPYREVDIEEFAEFLKAQADGS